MRVLGFKDSGSEGLAGLASRIVCIGADSALLSVRILKMRCRKITASVINGFSFDHALKPVRARVVL